MIRPGKASKWLPLFMRFIENLRIDSKEVQASLDGRGVPLEIWGSQEIFLEEICYGLDRGIRTFYCLKARQLGISTISLAIDIFWLAIHPGTQGCLVVDTEGNRDKFRLIIHRYIESFPKDYFGSAFQIVKGKDNRSFTHFTNGSNLDYLVAGTRKKATWGEGRAYNFAHVTEVSKYGDPAGLASFRETLAEEHPNRLYIYESTANGFNHWRDMWIDAGQDEHTKHRFFIGWWSKPINRIPSTDPRYAQYGRLPPDAEERDLIAVCKERYDIAITKEQLAWYRWRSSSVSSSEQDILQNLPWTEEQAFILSGFSFFQTRLIQRDIEVLTDPEQPVEYRGYRYFVGNDFHAVKCEPVDSVDDVELRVWDEPIVGARYVIGCDPAFGRNEHKDRHAISVWRCYADRLTLVAEYASSDCETRQAAWVLAHLAGAYRNCIVNLELTGGPGQAVMTEFNSLRDRLRADMFRDRVSELGWEDFLANASWYLYHRPDSMGAGYVYNFSTNMNSKFMLMNTYRDCFSTRALVIRSVPLLSEMQQVIQDGVHIGAPESSGETCKDDRVFAAALATKAWVDWVRPGMIANNETYTTVTRSESGEVSPVTATVDRIVSSFFKTAEERATAEDEAPKWIRDRGLA